MENNAFTAGVKPGGLTSSLEIRVLLCYLMHSVSTPLSRAELEQALVGEELVNYFELADSLAELCDNGFAAEQNGRYRLLPSGEDISATLGRDLPLSVRDTAIRAAVRAQQFACKAAQHKAAVERTADGYAVRCSIADVGGEAFSFSLYLPDSASAELVRRQFIEQGDTIYSLMLAAVTGNAAMAASALTVLQAQKKEQTPSSGL